MVQPGLFSKLRDGRSYIGAAGNGGIFAPPSGATRCGRVDRSRSRCQRAGSVGDSHAAPYGLVSSSRMRAPDCAARQAAGAVEGMETIRQMTDERRFQLLVEA